MLLGIFVGGRAADWGETAAAPAPRPAAPVAAPAGAPTAASCWGVIPSPNTGPTGNDLKKLAVVNANDIWAVGNDLDATDHAQALTMHWNGSAWSIIPNPYSGYQSSLSDVSARAANDVWAVGTSPTAGQVPLVLHWDGSAWSRTYAATSVDWSTSGFNGVVALAANDVWAVGSYYQPGNPGDQTLIEHWNGTAWSIVPSANASPARNVLNEIIKLTANDMWAVGSYFYSGVDHTLIEHWDGTAWTVVASPNPGFMYNFLYDIAAVSANDIWAVGFYQPLGGPIQPLTLHWDGTAWTQIPSPSTGQTSYLFGVASRTGTDTWAVGYGADTGTLFILHWDGTTWSRVAGVGLPGENNLNSVALVDANQVWAVGSATEGSDAGRTLTVRSGAPCITPSPVPATATPTATNTPLPTPTPHAGQFEDVPPNNPFYDYVECMGTREIISGYPCGGPGEPCVGPVNKPYFRPNNNITRGQTAKIVSNAAGWSEQSTLQHFIDVPPGSTFWIYVERVFDHSAINGYPCGGPGEPCGPGGDGAYFRPNNPVTRGQTAKIVAIAAGFSATPTAQTFEDVPPSGTFYPWVEQMASRGIIGGYPCGGPGEPCQPPSNRPYFRPNNNVTRGQTAKIVTNSFFPNCQNPSPTPTATATAGLPSATPTITATPGSFFRQ